MLSRAAVASTGRQAMKQRDKMHKPLFTASNSARPSLSTVEKEETKDDLEQTRGNQTILTALGMKSTTACKGD